jgi:chorismate lyase/3-hydroxybenzoate synthase
VTFGHLPAFPPSDPRRITVPLLPIGEAHEERWDTGSSVDRGVAGRFAWARRGEALVVQTRIEEIDEAEFENQVAELYRDLYAFLKRAGHPHPLRIWQYIERIHTPYHQLDRYQRFCSGRHRAINAHTPPQRLPAATVIGSQEPGFTLYALAAPEPALQIENPRQVSAFRYPPEYGPVSPSFSRAVLKRWASGGVHLYISGTASIVGHASRHPEDAEAQLEETLQNLQVLLERAVEADGPALRLDELSAFRLYLRHRHHAERVEARFRSLVGHAVPLVMLEGEICRRELLLEVEAAWYGEST